MKEMIDVTGVIKLLKEAFPQLKLAPSEIAAKTPFPYGTYTDEQIPKTTKDGVAGWDMEFELSIFEGTKEKISQLTQQVINAMHRVSIADGSRIYFNSLQYVYYPVENIHSYELKFNIKKR